MLRDLPIHYLPVHNIQDDLSCIHTNNYAPSLSEEVNGHDHTLYTLLTKNLQ